MDPGAAVNLKVILTEANREVEICLLKLKAIASLFLL